MSVHRPGILTLIYRRFFAVTPRRELKELYIFSALFSFAAAMITIFEPVFFYQEGFSLAMIALYYAMHYTLYTILLPFGGKFAAKFGLERSLSIAMPIFVLYFLTLSILPAFPGLYWVSWIILTLFKIFYWPAYHAAFAKFGDGGNRGTEVSFGYALRLGIGVLGPLIGGLIATYLGFPVLFVITAGIALFSGVPLLRTKEKFTSRPMDYWAAWKIIRSRQHRRMVLGTIGWAENLVDLMYWPVFAFIVLGSADKLGFVASFSVFIMASLAFFIGEMSDRFPRRAILRMHAPFVFLGYLFRLVASTPLRVLLTNTLALSANVGIKVPFFARVYSEARRIGSLRYMLALEIVVSLTKALFAILLFVIALNALPYTTFAVSFVLAGILSLFYVLL